MKGLELARGFYNDYGKQMIEEQFPEYAERIAVGFLGEGSDCLGYDDDLSADHDFEPAFCMFITQEDYDKFGFKLERAYAKLPKEYKGYKRALLSPTGGNRHGVITIEDFYTKHLGAPSVPDTVNRWLYTPSASLLNASNGEIFRDNLGIFSKIREELKKGYPEDIRLKKIAAHTIIMAQSGQYNYGRCIDRGETGAGNLCVYEFVRHAISVIYLLNNAYEPFYKWAFRGMRDLHKLNDLEFTLSGILEMGNGRKEASEKREIIEDISRMIIEEFHNQNITEATCNNLETHAYSVQNKIKDAGIRNLHIMDGI